MFQRFFNPPRHVWAEAVLGALKSCSGPVSLSYIHGFVEGRFPKLAVANPNWWGERLPLLLEQLEEKGIVVNIVDAARGTWDVGLRKGAENREGHAE